MATLGIKGLKTSNWFAERKTQQRIDDQLLLTTNNFNLCNQPLALHVLH